MQPHQNQIIKQFVQQLKKDLQSIKQHQSAIIFTGLTGSGKGTLIHYLMKNRRLYAETSQTGDIIISMKPKLTGPRDEITISSKMQSDTSIPQEISYKGEVYRDLPGFMDTREQQRYITQDIINSFFIHEVYEKTKKVKIVFTASKNSLNDKAIEFIGALTHFSERFQNVGEIMGSIFLVVTKVPVHFQVKHIRFILSKILDELKPQIPQNTRKILEQWTQSPEVYIQLFKVPEKQGPISFTSADLIHKKIRAIPYSPSPTIQNIISEYSLAKMVDLQGRWNLAISQICYEFVKSSYEEYLKKIQKIKMLNTAKSSLNYLRHKLDQLMGAQNPEEFRVRLRNVPQLYNPNKGELMTSSRTRQLTNQFEEYFEFMQLFQKIHPLIHNTPKWKQPLYKIHHNISQIVSQPWQQVHGEDIYIKGFVVESVVIQKKINFYKNNLTSARTKGKVVIFAYFFIMNQDIEYPGGNVMIYAQYFIVEQTNLKIRLNGQNAKDYSVLTDDDNTDGQPGRPGQNAGNLLLKVYQRCDNLQYFSVDLRGGRGGKGKNGGEIKLPKPNKLYMNDLKHDKDLPTSDKKYLLYREDYKFSERNIISKMVEVFRILGTYNGQVVQFYSTEVGIENNLQHFTYTLGGIGGKPGHSGNLHIDVGDKAVCLVDKPEPSVSGQAHVQVYQGLYVKEMIFPNFREEGKEVNIKALLEQKKFQMQYKNVQQKMKSLCQKNKQRYQKTFNTNQRNKLTDIMESQQPKTKSFTTNDLINIVAEAQKEIQEEEELTTPVLYKTKYKEEAEYFDQDLVIREEDNQEDDNQNDLDSTRAKKITKTKQFNSQPIISIDPKNFSIKRSGTTTNFNPPNPVFIHRKPQRRTQIQSSSLSRTTLPSYEETVNQNSLKYSQLSQSNRTIRSITTSQQSNNRMFSSPLIQPKKNGLINVIINGQKEETQLSKKSTSELFMSKIKEVGPMWGKEVTMEVATDIGTGTVQKLAQRIINKICERALRTGITMQKEVLKQFVENALKSQAENKMLASLGILTGQTFSRQIAKAAAAKVQQSIMTSLGKQVFRDTAGLLQRQALKHLGQDLAMQGVKKMSSQAVRQAQIQLAAKSLTSGTIYTEGMLEGLGKSIFFQVFLSAVMASGVTDGWIINPHFKSKKMELKVYNEENIQMAEPHYDFTTEEMNLTEEEYKFFVSSFRQFQSVFANKT